MNEREKKREEVQVKKRGFEQPPNQSQRFNVMTVMGYLPAKDSSASVSHPKEPEFSQRPLNSDPHAHRSPYPDDSSPFGHDTARAAISCV